MLNPNITTTPTNFIGYSQPYDHLTQNYGALYQPVSTTATTAYPVKLITTDAETKLFYFSCHFDHNLFKELLEFKLHNAEYIENNSLKLTYRFSNDELIVLITNNTIDKVTNFTFTLEPSFYNSYNYNVLLVNKFKKEFMLLADKPATKCSDCLFIIDAKLETFCNKSYKPLGIE